MLHEAASTREIEDELEMLRRKNKAMDKYLGTLKGDSKYLLPDLMSDLRTNAWGKMRKNAIEALKKPSNILSHAVSGFNPFKDEWDKDFHKSIFNRYKKDLMQTASKEGNSKLKKLKDTLKKNLITQDEEDRLGFAPLRKYDKLNRSDRIISSDLIGAIGLQNLLKRGKTHTQGYLKMLKNQVRRELDGEHVEDLEKLFRPEKKIPFKSPFGEKIIPGVGTVLGVINSKAVDTGYTPPYHNIPDPWDPEFDSYDPSNIINNFKKKKK